MTSNKILFITYNRLGDAVLSSGIYKHICQIYPHAKITVVCGPTPAPLFYSAPNLNRVYILNKKHFSAHWLDLWRKTIVDYWDMVVDLRGSAIAWLLLTTNRKILFPRKTPTHRVSELADLFAAKEVPAPSLWTNKCHETAAQKLIPEGRPVLAIGPTANWGGKQWPADRFARLALKLTDKSNILPEATIAVLGAKHERDATQLVIDQLPQSRCLDLAGKVELPTLYACLRRCQMYIGNDSGLMHMAAAAKIPTLGLFGPSREELYGPWGSKGMAVRTNLSFEDIITNSEYDYRKHKSWMLDLHIDKAEKAAVDLYARCVKEANSNDS